MEMLRWWLASVWFVGAWGGEWKGLEKFGRLAMDEAAGVLFCLHAAKE